MTVKSPCPAGCGTMVEYGLNDPIPFCKTKECVANRKAIVTAAKIDTASAPKNILDSSRSRLKLPRVPGIPGLLEQSNVILCDAAGNPIIKQFDNEGNEIRPPNTEINLPNQLFERCQKHSDVPGIYKGKRVIDSYPSHDCFQCKQDALEAAAREAASKNKPMERHVPKPEVTIESVRNYLGVKAAKPVLPRPPRNGHGSRKPDLSPILENIRFTKELGIPPEQLSAWLNLDVMLYYKPDKPAKQPKREEIQSASMRLFSPIEDIEDMEATLADLENPSYDSGLTPQQVRGKKVRNPQSCYGRIRLRAKQRRVVNLRHHSQSQRNRGIPTTKFSVTASSMSTGK